MGKADTITKEYMQNTVVFADAFNYLIYDGEQVIQPEQLRELDTTELTTLFGENNENAQVQVYRDVLKSVTAMEDGECAYLILGIENQSAIHYAMPVRNMLYDALQYHSQARAITGKHRTDRSEAKLTKDEFLSGFRKTDRLLPVVTLVVYFGAKAWDGPKSIHEMLTVRDRRLLSYVADYRINPLEPSSMADEEIGKLKSDLKSVFKFIKYSRDMDKLLELVEDDENFHNMSRNTAEMINTVTDAKIRLSEEEEKIDMCLAIDQMQRKSKEEGRLEGKLEGRLEGRLEGKLEGRLEGKLEGRLEGKLEGIEEGKEKGKLEMLFDLVQEGFLTISQASFKAKLAEDQFMVEMAKAGF